MIPFSDFDSTELVAGRIPISEFKSSYSTPATPYALCPMPIISYHSFSPS